MEGALEEQIAGLLYDVAYLGFSSTAILVKDYSRKEFLEVMKDKFVYNSENTNILQRYHIDIGYVLNEQNFSILEK